MMKKIICLMLPLCIGLASCHEDDPLLFNDKARVQLRPDASGTFGDYSYSFIWSPASTTRDVVYLPIRVMGGPADTDRHVMIEQVNEYDITYTKDHWGYVTDSVVTERSDKAIAGKHYVPFDSPEYGQLLTIPAGEVLTQIGIILIRDASLSSEKVRLRIRLKPTDDFELGESKYLERTITFSDMLEQPSNWAQRYMNSYFGTYSKTKHQLMMKVVNGKVDEDWVNQAYNSVSFRYYWRMKFIEALQAYNNDPSNIASGLAPMRENADDPNSALVTFPTSL
ncbi:MAG: DUF4843 domain-containing protein [Prevotella sp.]|nr:DUF4843 domain-containing protein [Prevotella sp.]